MVDRKYELLKQANDHENLQKKKFPLCYRPPQIKRKKYWGELNDGNSQAQID